MSNQFVDCGSFQNTEFKWTHSANWLLINSYLDMKEEFRDPGTRKRDLWIRISDKFRDNGYEIPHELLDKKFRNLKATYYQVRERKRHSANKQIKWEYYKVFEDLLQEEETVVASSALAIETPVTSNVQDDPRLANFRSSVYVPVDGRKRKRTVSKSKSAKETTKLVNIEPVVDALDDETMDDCDKPNMNGDHRFKDDLTAVDGAIMEDSQDGTFDDDDEEYEDDISANYDVPSLSKKNLSILEAKKIQAETRYFHKKADYFEKQTLCLDIQRKLMIMQAHKLKLEIERMKNEKKNESFSS